MVDRQDCLGEVSGRQLGLDWISWRVPGERKSWVLLVENHVTSLELLLPVIVWG